MQENWPVIGDQSLTTNHLTSLLLKNFDVKDATEWRYEVEYL